MSKRLIAFLGVVFFLVFLLVACGSDKDDSKDKSDDKDEKKTEEVTKEIDEDKEKDKGKDGDKEKKKDESVNKDFPEFIEYMEDETDGEAELLMEGTATDSHELEDLKVSVGDFALVELKDFHKNYSIPFGDETDGGVFIVEYIVENDSDESLYFMPSLDIEYEGMERHASVYRDLIPEEEQISAELYPKSDYELEAGESVSGYLAYPFKEDAFEQLQEVGIATVKVPTAFSKPEDYSADSVIGEKGNITIPLDEEGQKQAEEDGNFYEDRVILENMGKKEMIVDKQDVDAKEDLRDVTVHLDGYQFTEFTPNEDQARRFDFDEDEDSVILLTTKLTLENKGDEKVGLSQVRSNLHVDNGKKYMLNEGILEPNSASQDVVEPGDKEEVIKVFILDKEEYEKLYKDKDFMLEVGPLYNEDTKDISKGDSVELDLPK